MLLVGCATTGTVEVDMIGQTRPPLDDTSVEVYQSPQGLLSEIPNRKAPTGLELIARLETSGVAKRRTIQDVSKTASQMVSSLKRQAAKLGANALVVRDVVVAEEQMAGQAIPRTLNVRAFENGIEEYDAEPDQIMSRQVLKVTVKADSMFHDANGTSQ